MKHDERQIKISNSDKNVVTKKIFEFTIFIIKKSDVGGYF